MRGEGTAPQFSPNTLHTQETIMSNKNPFEIRQEVLKMAKDYMDQQWSMNLKFTQELFTQGTKTVEEVQSALKMYSSQDLIDKAAEMYTFVTKKD